MATPWQTIENVSTQEGLLELRQRGKGDYLITIDGRILMNSLAHRSEIALGELVCGYLSGRTHPRILIGGLGMGYTLKAVLDNLRTTATVMVAELNPAVVKWCRGPLAELTGGAVKDPRVHIKIDDVANLIRRYANEDEQEKFDAIVLDLYTGPYLHSHAKNDPIYGNLAINNTHNALKSNGIFAVWGENYEAGFANRLSEAGFITSTHRSGKGSARHVMYIGKFEP